MKQSKQVINFDTKEVFASVQAAAKYYKVSHKTISRICRGELSSVKLSLAFLQDYEQNTIPVFIPPIKTYYVYKLTSPNGKVYIGVTSDIKHRWRGHGMGYKGSTWIYNAIQTFGWDNFEKEILYSGLSREEASIKEAELIRLYQSNSFEYGYNMQSGGFVGFSCGEESVQKASNSLKGRNISEQALLLNKLHQPNRREVYCVETGQSYITISEAARQMGVTSEAMQAACSHKNHTCKGYHWEYADKQ